MMAHSNRRVRGSCCPHAQAQGQIHGRRSAPRLELPLSSRHAVRRAQTRVPGPQTAGHGRPSGSLSPFCPPRPRKIAAGVLFALERPPHVEAGFRNRRCSAMQTHGNTSNVHIFLHHSTQGHGMPSRHFGFVRERGVGSGRRSLESLRIIARTRVTRWFW